MTFVSRITWHLLRAIDLHLDLSELRRHLAPFYSHTGRPSVDPDLVVRMLLIGYCFSIRSERRLCEEVQVNLAYRWFCRLGLDEAVPEHSTFSKTRHGRLRGSDAFRFLFEEVAHRAMVEGLVGGEGFAVDASAVKADANRQRGVAGDVDVDWGAPEQMRRPIREYLDGLEAYEPPKAPKNLSLTDPMARWTTAPGGPAFYAYSTNYLVDIDAAIAQPPHELRNDPDVPEARSQLPCEEGVSRVVSRYWLTPDALSPARRARAKPGFRPSIALMAPHGGA